MIEGIIPAFCDVRDGYSPDRVVADPEVNAQFILACKSRKLGGSQTEWNQALLNARKRGGLPATTRRTLVRDQEAYAFAAEIAIRSLERKHRTSLDQVLCDPELASEFDSVAGEMCPGFSSLEYRWAALRLRKSNHLKPEIIGRAVPTEVIGPVEAAGLDVSRIPTQQGLYILENRDSVLYVGEAKNLRVRLKKHLDHSDNKHLARYLWEAGLEGLFIEYHVLPEGTRADVRKAMELELIRSRRAEFNVQR